jgi:hypothetical protein
MRATQPTTESPPANKLAEELPSKIDGQLARAFCLGFVIPLTAFAAGVGVGIIIGMIH